MAPYTNVIIIIVIIIMYIVYSQLFQPYIASYNL